MFDNFFPRQIDNAYRGQLAGLWIFALVALVKLLQGATVAGLNPMRTSAEVLEGIDRVPLGEFPSEAASHLVFLFSAWGLCIFVLGLFGLLVLTRYRAAIPLAYLLFLIEQLGRRGLTALHLEAPFLSLSLSPAALVNWGFLAAIVVGLALSLWPRPARERSTP